MEWSLLTSGVLRRRLKLSRSGRDGEELLWLFGAIWRFGEVLVALSTRGRCMERGRRRAVAGLRVLREGCVTCRLWWFGWTPQFFGFTCVVELQLDLSSMTARLRVVVSPVVVCHGVGTVVVVVGVEVELCSVGVVWLTSEASSLGNALPVWLTA
ncbi:hypothetical protein Taro_035614 [Colocasia esculenta]|uniref:Uncharacterized protein n=1 Tax=Colocasia esculenta TaxID=4460 RepID=A0A843W4B4_COLES|nr:hypothetical protein [Colocasia esculenta]